MKITDQTIAIVSEVAKPASPKAAATKSDSPSRSGSIDKVKLPLSAGQSEAIKKTLEQIPNIRSGKVERLKAEIASGEYRVDGGVAAAKILETWSRKDA